MNTFIPPALEAMLNDPDQSLFLPKHFLQKYGVAPTTVAAFIHAGLPVPEYIRSQKAILAIQSKSGLFERIPRYEPEEAKLLLCGKQAQKSHADALYDRECEWCRGKAPVLHAHHYPLPRSKGGTDTVNICPNCHTEFHYLVQPRYRLTDEARQTFDAARKMRLRELKAQMKQGGAK